MAAVASRYARAFAEVVIDLKIEPERALQEVHAISDLVTSSAELRTVLQNPSVERVQKLRLLDAIVARLGASRPLRNFVAVLIDHRRIGQIHEIAEKFVHELDQRLGIAEAQVKSARHLNAEEKALLETEIASITGKTVRATYAVDGDLLGGATVQVGSTIYDGSVRGQLRKIKENLVNG